MINKELVSTYLEDTNQYPEIEEEAGLTLRMVNGDLLIKGTADDYIELANLLVSLALSKENKGQHWHVNSMTLLDEQSEIQELILARK